MVRTVAILDRLSRRTEEPLSRDGTTGGALSAAKKEALREEASKATPVSLALAKASSAFILCFSFHLASSFLGRSPMGPDGW